MLPNNLRDISQSESSDTSYEFVGLSHYVAPTTTVANDKTPSNQSPDSDTRSAISIFDDMFRIESTTGSNNTPLQQHQQRSPKMGWRERQAAKNESKQKEKEVLQPQRQQRLQHISALEQEKIPLQAKLHDIQLHIGRLRRLDEIEDRLLEVKKEQQELGLEETRLTDEQELIFRQLAATPEVVKEQK
ncbi:hypothetical protein BGZ96_008773 [Linnemannia gamsii]|uniref:Uncharacterized protein n=1 Tax=Linnemannia gamsii TaxID=64522 RepID=A0ABQ7JYD1_9FUNG|nr:hypothetical protein BGZ96_008773 [Linnemannia gamsii]